MTSKHFKVIAEVLNKQLEKARYTDKFLTPALTGEENEKGTSSEVFRVECIASQLANQFGQFNPLFNRSKFLAVALA